MSSIGSLRALSPSRTLTRRYTRAFVSLGLALLGAGSALSCGGDAPGPGGPLGPGDPPAPGDPPQQQPPPVVSALTTLDVMPAAADLCVPGNNVQLTIVPRDQTGAPMSNGAGTTTYSSSAPAIAEVSSGGLVTAVAPGTAVIAATFTHGAVTRAASMNVTVREGSDEYPEIGGVYGLTAVVTAWDWPDSPTGISETGFITIQHSPDTPLFTGT